MLQKRRRSHPRPLIARTTAFFRIKRCSYDTFLSLSLSIIEQLASTSKFVQDSCNFDRLFFFFSISSSFFPLLLLLLRLPAYDEYGHFAYRFETVFDTCHAFDLNFSRRIDPKNISKARPRPDATARALTIPVVSRIRCLKRRKLARSRRDRYTPSYNTRNS